MWPRPATSPPKIPMRMGGQPTHNRTRTIRMRVPLTVADSIDRAAWVYPERVGIIDEPSPPGGGLGALTYRRVAELAAAQAAGLDERGIGVGERVAVVSQNAARL